ncbi:hypothetical protein LARI1_G008192 [Lachnellula arida]|uniref:Uncharacterized protein n=1 Tax=Lachnellula arida TaxID=1316785 RepID=A0A8T9B7G4_9HELO|nr:hypothetical protein LARI1_G008192 [Lachnellula arida]
MANMEHPPRTSSRWPTPGLHVNLEFGVSFAHNDPPHTASMKYTSKNMQERMYYQQQENLFRQQKPQRLMPGDAQERRYQQQDGLSRQHNPQRPVPVNTQERLYQQQEGLYRQRNSQRLVPGNTQGRMYQQQEGFSRQQNTQRLMPGSTQERQPRSPQRHRSLEVRPTYGYERGSSAPPTLQPMSPVSPMSPITPLPHTSSMPIEERDRPLPATPSHFRLGEDGLPWSTEPFYRCEDPGVVSPIRPAVVEIELEGRRTEDPQRVRELEELHQAMMTVDSLDHDGWEAWTWDSVGDFPRGPRSLGWAISTNPTSDDFPQNNLEPPPPPYVVSQWESTFGRQRIRPRSAFS